MPKTRKSKHPKGGTETTAFGSPGRRGHDSSRFYSSRLYDEMPKEIADVPYVEQKIPSEYLDRIFTKSSEKMEQLPDRSIHLMVTSPPYNVGKEYDEDFTINEYLALLSRVLGEVRRVLVPGGRACINVANLGRKPYIPLNTEVIHEMLNLGFLMRGEIIWDKGASAASSTAWGSWCSASNPILRDTHEYILVFSKDTYTRKNPSKKDSTIEREEFLEWTKSVWNFPTESAKRVNHPAPFPIELPLRIIKLYTFEGEVVLDPFMGSGTTAIAALQSNRHFIGYEINEEYVEISVKRIKQFKA